PTEGRVRPSEHGIGCSGFRWAWRDVTPCFLSVLGGLRSALLPGPSSAFGGRRGASSSAPDDLERRPGDSDGGRGGPGHLPPAGGERQREAADAVEPSAGAELEGGRGRRRLERPDLCPRVGLLAPLHLVG